MHYIIFDLEFNQDFFALQDIVHQKNRYPFEIIQIGAVKLDLEFHTVSTFNRYVKPTIYSQISPFVTELTSITTMQLQKEEPFKAVYNSFHQFIGESDSIFCTWGMSDIKELYKNAIYHELDSGVLLQPFINIQPYTSIHFGLSSKNLLGLENAVKALTIPITNSFHNALHDAYYTAEIFKRIYTPAIESQIYNPSYVNTKPRPKKKVIDFDVLIRQFEKMYDRNMTKEEQEIIKLAYKMGKTHQFLK